MPLVGLLFVGCQPSAKEGAADVPPPPPSAVQNLGALDATAQRTGAGDVPRLAPVPLAVVGYGPQGQTDGAGTIYVRFNQPVGALELDDAQRQAALPGLSLSPAVEGEVHFTSPELLTFKPKGELKQAQKYTVTLRGPVQAQSGVRWDAPLSWDFETPRPRVERTMPENHESNIARTRPLLIHLTQPSTAAEVQAHIKARGVPVPVGSEKSAATPQPIAVTVTDAVLQDAQRYTQSYFPLQKGRSFAIKPQGLWPAASDVTVEVTPGLHSTSGPLPGEAPFAVQFQTILPLKLTKTPCGPQEPCGLEPVVLAFNNPVPSKQRKRITISPRPESLSIDAADYSSPLGQTDLTISGVLLPGTTYRVSVPGDLTDGYGQKLGATQVLPIVIARRPTLELSETRGTLMTTAPQTIGLVSRHVTALRVRAALLNDQDVAALLLALSEPDDENHLDEASRLAQLSWPDSGHRQAERTLLLKPSGATDWASTALNLGELLGQVRGAVLVEAVATHAVTAAEHEPLPKPVRGLYRITDLGPVLVSSLRGSLIAVPRLSNQQPVAGATLSRIIPGQPARLLGTTDRSGLLAFTEEAQPDPKPADKADKKDKNKSTPGTLYVIQDGSGSTLDRAYLETSAERGAASPPDPLRPGERLILHLTTERDLYMPGERVRAVGWAAIDTPHERSGLARPAQGTKVAFTLLDAQDRTVATAQSATTGEGKFWAELPIPGQGSLGRFHVKAELLGKETGVSVKVEDFRVPEFSVAATVSVADLVLSRSPGAPPVPTVRASASYYFGGPVPIQRASYHHTCRTSTYRPPGLGIGWHVGLLHFDWDTGRTATPIELGLAAKDAQQGRVQFEPMRDQIRIGLPNRCSVDVTVADASYQSQSGHTEYLVHPARYYLALKEPAGAVETGSQLSLPLQALTYDGKRVAARGVEATIERFYSVPIFKKANKEPAEEEAFGDEEGAIYDRTEERHEHILTAHLAIPADGADGQLAFTPRQPGSYHIKLRGAAADDAADAQTTAEIYVYRREPHVTFKPRPAPQRLEIELGASAVKPGDTLGVELRSPRPTPFGLLVLARNGLRDSYPLVLAPDGKDGKLGRGRLELPVDDSWFQRVTLSALVVERPPGELPKVETALSSVSMGQEHRNLQVQIEAPSQAGAGARVPVRVRVFDAQGQALPPQAMARVALWAVDEAVLDLTGYSTTNPLSHFVPQSGPGLSTHHEFGSLLLPFTPSTTDPWLLQLTGRSVSEAYGAGGFGLGGSGSGGGAGMALARQDFQITPLFLADVAVESDGVAKVDAKLPDNLTTFRITAVASARLVDGQSPGRFGLSDARLRTTAPLIVRAAVPRLMRPGDRAEAAAIINNLGGPAGQVRLTAQLHQDPLASLRLLSPAETTLNVAEGEVVRVPFQLLAERPGPAAIEFSIAMQGPQTLSDAIRVPIPVQLERPIMERLATYGSLTTAQAVALPIRLPSDADPQYGGLHLQASTSLIGDVEAAAKELIEYPYGCAEQTASRLVPMVALAELARTHASKRALAALKLENLSEFVAAGVQRLLSMQRPNGGLAYWPDAKEPNPYATAYALWVLAQVQQGGYPVPAEALKRAADYLYQLLEPKSDVTSADADLVPFSPRDPMDDMRAALALHALSQLQRPAKVATEQLYQRRSQLPLFARALLLMAMHKANPQDPKIPTLTEELLGNLTEQQGTAHAVERISYSLESIFHSDARSDAIVLLALLQVRPESPIVPKLVRGLLDRRPGAAWRNTQENAYALMALAQYSQRYETQPPAFTGRAWLGQRSLWSAQLRASEDDPHPAATIDIPIAQLLLPQGQSQSAKASQEVVPIILQRTGSGRMYYRVGLDWSPIEAAPKPRSQGLHLTRELRGRMGAISASDSIAAASAVAFELTIENSDPLRYVAIDVPLPAGLEVLQTRINSQVRTVPFPGTQGDFVSHEEAWRDRVVIFADELQPGHHVHTVYLRATTSGLYALPPARAEAMYTPEIYGRSGASSVQIR